MILFPDNSDLVKVYIAEPGSERMRPAEVVFACSDRNLLGAAAEGLVIFDPAAEPG